MAGQSTKVDSLLYTYRMGHDAVMSEQLELFPAPSSKEDPKDKEIIDLKEKIVLLSNQLEKNNLHAVPVYGYSIKYLKEDRKILIQVGNKFGSNTDRVTINGGMIVTGTEAAIKEITDSITKFLNSFKISSSRLKE